MSTRAMIDIEGLDNIYFYKHSDGYPGDIVPILQSLIDKFKVDRGWDAEYLMAHICREFTRNTEGFLGYGICNKKHGDISYFYTIRKNWEIYARSR